MEDINDILGEEPEVPPINISNAIMAEAIKEQEDEERKLLKERIRGLMAQMSHRRSNIKNSLTQQVRKRKETQKQIETTKQNLDNLELLENFLRNHNGQISINEVLAVYKCGMHPDGNLGPGAGSGDLPAIDQVNKLIGSNLTETPTIRWKKFWEFVKNNTNPAS